VSGVSPPFDSDFRGSSVAESLYLSESLRPITTEFNLFFSRGGICIVGSNGIRRRRYLVCYNPQEAKQHQHRRHEIVAQFQAELARHKNHKATAQWAIDLLASPHTKRYLTVTDNGEIRIDRPAIEQAARTDGKWVLETNWVCLKENTIFHASKIAKSIPNDWSSQSGEILSSICHMVFPFPQSQNALSLVTSTFAL